MQFKNKNNSLRKSDQFLIPVRKESSKSCKYDIYPSLVIGSGKIFCGFESLAGKIMSHKAVMLDGYAGVFFDDFRYSLGKIFEKSGLTVFWADTRDYFRQSSEINKLAGPFLGGDDPLFGKRCPLNIKDFLDPGKIESVKPDPESDISIICGPGAFLAGWDGLLVYADIPKNEIQYRSRAGAVTNLGIPYAEDPKRMYKRFYFVDWVVLNRHKQHILPVIDVFVDAQRPDDPVWMEGKTLRESLSFMAGNMFRVRPWFEPGTWGGRWIMENIEGLNRNVQNYAWSFELISPENGLLIESSSVLCEVSFDCLMYQEAEAVLGGCHHRFGTEFPIRFDFLDTFDGGNLSIQCHPRPDYIRQNFGENFTQEEAYYILDTKDNAVVYLGFRDAFDPEEFRRELEDSSISGKPVDIEKYISVTAVNKHDLLLVPFGTVHGSGKNNLVLEISSTPYIFTFKMYDWLRPDLDGRPRPLNIDRGMASLYTDRKGSYVGEKLVSKPVLEESGPDWQVFHLPTHETHLYDVKRLHFRSEIKVDTGNKCLVMNLVEGRCIRAETAGGYSKVFSYAETFVIPAAAGTVIFTNLSGSDAMIVMAFVK